MKKLKSILLVAICSFVFGIMFVNADTAHQMSFNTYTCESLNSAYECDGTPTPIGENGAVNPGDIIKLDLYYVPGTQVDKSMQIRFTFNDTDLEPVYNGSNLAFTPALTPMLGGIYPAMGASGYSAMLTNWTIQANQSNNIIAIIIKDNTLNDPLVNEGVLTSFYFRVKSTATPGDSLAFTYLPAHTLFANQSPITLTNRTLDVYKEKDTDTSLKSLTVTNGSTNYLTNFNKDTKTYTVYVPNQVSTVNISAEATSATTDVIYAPSATGNNYSLNVSTTKTVTITTEAESEDTDNYTVNVYRLSNADTLTSLTLSNVNIGTFASGTTSYTATVPYTTSKTNISATPASNKATVTGTGNNKTINVGSNNVFNIVVTPENCKSEYSSVLNNTCSGSKTYTVTVTRTAASTNANLASLTVDGTSVPNFSPNTTTYTLNDVVGTTSSVTVAATLADDKATIVSGTGSQSLNYGNNALTVVVKPEDPNTANKTYTINIKRLYNDPKLSSLSITSNPSGTLVPASFNANTKEYTYTVGPDVTAVTITGASNKNASITGNGTYDPRTTAKVEINTTSEDNTATDKYTVNIVRNKSANKDLDSLTVGSYTLTPNYANDVDAYDVTIPSSATSVNITATPHDSRSHVEDAGLVSDLGIGDTVHIITVVAEDESTRPITITIHRQNNEARLSSLTLSGITIPFNKDTKTYSVTVPYTTDKTTVSATPMTGATIVNAQSNLGVNNLTAGATTTIKVKTNAEDPSVTDEYTVNVTRTAAATDNTLSDLKVNNATVNDFSPSTESYTLTSVKKNVTSINIAATPNNEFAEIVSGTGNIALSLGDNALPIVVKAQNGSTKTYTINIRVLNDNSNLSTLSVTPTGGTGSLSPTFNKGTTSYTYTIDPDVSKVTISGTCEDTLANISGGGDINNPKTGDSKTIRCTAEDETYTDYTVNIVRNKSEVVTLSDLLVNGSTIQGFNANTGTYNININPDIDTVTIEGVKGDSRQTLTPDAPQVITTENPGDYSATILVQAEDTTKSKTYTVNIHKLSDDATLTSLSLDGITLNPTFSPSETNYTASVLFAKSTTNITATAAAGATIVSGSDIGNKNIGVGDNTYTITTKAEDGTTSLTYTIVVTRSNASTNALLSDLRVDGTQVPEFSSDKLEYTVSSVANSVSKVTITATPEDNTSTISGDGERTINVGNNRLEVSVTPESGGDPTVYVINIRRKNNDNTLSDLEISSNPTGTLNPATGFDPNTEEYTYTVDPDTDSITVTPTGPDGSTVIITPCDLDGNPTTGDGPYDPNEISKVEITVTPEDGTPKTYTVNLDREESANNALLTLGVKDYTISPEFNVNTSSYTLTVPYSTTKVEIIGSVEDNRSTIHGLGEKTLTVGENSFNVYVTSESGVDGSPYTIKVTRSENNDTSISGITIDGDPLNGFTSDTKEYTLSNLGPDVDSITIVATPNAEGATVSGDGVIVLSTGLNEIPITVTAPDGSQTNPPYVIKVTRDPSTNNALASLGVEGYTITPSYSADTHSYEVTIPNNITSVTITGTAAHERATVNGIGLKENLAVGNNDFNVYVTSESNVDGSPYTVRVIRQASADATLSGITIDGEALDEFDPNQDTYELNVPYDKASVVIAATPSADGASVSGDGTITLNEGVNEIPITVTAPDGNTTKPYTIIINKAEANDNRYLGSLTIAGYTYTPDFDKTIDAYEVNVPVGTETISIDATPEVNTSTVAGTGSNIPLPNDDTVITLTVTSQKGLDKPYTITVHKVDDDEFITSLIYGHTIADGMIKTVEIQTTPNGLKDQLDNDNSKLFIYAADGTTLIPEEEFVGTGAVVKLIINGSLKDSKIAFIRGDVNGDGNITLFDAICIFSHLIGKEPLTGYNALAADTDESGSISLFDAIKIFQYLLGQGF